MGLNIHEEGLRELTSRMKRKARMQSLENKHLNPETENPYIFFYSEIDL
jgi:hypothetical protein